MKSLECNNQDASQLRPYCMIPDHNQPRALMDSDSVIEIVPCRFTFKNLHIGLAKTVMHRNNPLPFPVCIYHFQLTRSLSANKNVIY